MASAGAHARLRAFLGQTLDGKRPPALARLSLEGRSGRCAMQVGLELMVGGFGMALAAALAWLVMLGIFRFTFGRWR